jgi:GT2 family glycosyltransferase
MAPAVGMPDVTRVPLVSVSIVSHGDGEAVRSLLASMRAHEVSDRLQLILTDNLGHDLPQLEDDGWDSVSIIRNDRPQGYARNHNSAFRLARGEYFCVVNPDVVFIEPLFRPLILRLEMASAAIAAPIVVDPAGRLEDSFRSLPSPLELVRRRVGRAMLRPTLLDREPIFPDWTAGIFMLMRHGTFADLAGFDERYWLYFEDVDLCTRARLLGQSILVDPTLRLQHDARRSSRRPGRHLLWHLQSAARFFLSPVYRRARRLPTADA